MVKYHISPSFLHLLFLVHIPRPIIWIYVDLIAIALKRDPKKCQSLPVLRLQHCLWCPYTATDKLRWECPSPWLHHGVPSWTHGDVWMQIPKKKRGLGIPGIGGFYPNGNRVATQGYTKIYRSNHSKCNWQRNNISTVSERLARPFQNCLVNKESTMDYDTGLWKWIIKVYKDHDIPQYIG